jgi:hypothetical protein
MFAFVQGGKRTNHFANKHMRAHMQLMLPSWPELLRGLCSVLTIWDFSSIPFSKPIVGMFKVLFLHMKKGVFSQVIGACRVLVLDPGSEASPVGTT